MKAEIHLNGTLQLEITAGDSAIERAVVTEFLLAAKAGKPVKLLPVAGQDHAVIISIEAA